MPTSTTISIRPAFPDDSEAIMRLAALDSAPVPRSPLLLAEQDGELRAALSVADGRAIADPFALTANMVALLRLHASSRDAVRPAAASTQGRRRRRVILRAA